MDLNPQNTSVEIGNFGKSHRVWKTVAFLSIILAMGLVALGVSWDQLTDALWIAVAFCWVFAAFMWGLTLVMQRSLRIEDRGLVRASAVRESVTPWSEIGGARVGHTDLGDRFPKLIIEDADGRLLRGYGRGLINRPMEEAAEEINARLRG